MHTSPPFPPDIAVCNTISFLRNFRFQPSIYPRTFIILPCILHRKVEDVSFLIQAPSFFPGQTYPHRIITDLEEAREQSLDDVVTIRLANPQFVDPHTGNDLVPLPSGLLLPVITRREFKYKTANPQAKDNPHTAVLRGYRSRKRDEKIAFANQVDFTASTVNECAMRHKRYEQFNQFVEL